MKFAAIADWADSDEYPVTFMCRELGVATSGYYDWRTAGLSRRAQTDAELILDPPMNILGQRDLV